MSGPSLDAWRRALDRLSSDAVSETAREMTDKATALVDDEFASGHDPDGGAWAPLKSGGGTPLVATGALAADARPVLTSRGLAIRTSLPYAGFHQNGTSRMPARPFAPTSTLPAPWAVAFREAASVTFQRLLK